jgi:hypothetical protein
VHFTVVFDGPEHRDLSYGLMFVPSPVWMAGDREILNLHPDYPSLRLGDVAALLEKEDVRSMLEKASTKCTVVVHSAGHASEKDLATLRRGLTEEGFAVAVAGSV